MKRFENNRQLILYFLKGAKRYFLFGACFAALVSVLDLAGPKVISFTVDSVIGTDEPLLPPFLERCLETAGGVGTLRRHLLWIALAVAVLGLLSALCRYLFRSLNARGAERFVERMRNELFAHILTLPYTWIGENSTGDIIQRCTSDVQTIKRFISEQMTALVRTFLLIGLAEVFMAGIHVPVTLAVSAFIPVVIGYSLFFHGKIGSAFEKADVEEGKLSAIAQENLTGVRVVRSFGREKFERDRFERQNKDYTGYWIHLFKLMSAFWASGDVLSGLQTMTVVTLGAWYCVKGSLTQGGYIAMISYTLMLIWPVRTLGRVISEMSKAGIAMDRLRYIMNSRQEKTVPEGLTPPMDRDIDFSHVTFAYDEGREPVLSDVSLHIRAGSTVGILGGTGSGKSTLMYLLEKLYVLPEGCGSITIGGVDIRQIQTRYLRQNTGIVLQEPFLFSRTLEDNIGMAKTAPSREEIRRASSIASMDTAIENFAQGYDTFVGERGVTLSGGQKQRTAIAQMLVRETPVMIFDDSLSAVDAATDRRIRAALKEATADATVILISHRIATLMHADHIAVLDKGRIAEEGTHDQLMAAQGVYYRIFKLQSAGAGRKDRGEETYGTE